jgi:hypothetical protein
MGKNRINNSEISMNNVGLQRFGEELGKVGLGVHNPYKDGVSQQIPIYLVLRNLTDASPFAFRAKQTPITLTGDLATGGVRYPSVLYSSDGFGSHREDPNTVARVFKRWRMYIQRVSTGGIYMVESDDGVSWGTPEQLSTTQFPEGAAKAAYGVTVSYDADGLVTYDDGTGAVTYKFASVYRVDNLTTGDATDMKLVVSNDGVTWVAVAMANHDVSGDPYVEVASSLGWGSAGMFKQDATLTFNANYPKTFFGSDGWHSYQKYADAPVNAGDTVFGCTIMGQNSSDDTDANEMGHFANWKRNILRQVGERSFGQATKMVVWHVTKYKDVYLALVQLYYHVGGGATLVPSGLALAISRDGLIFEAIGPLYDVGLTHALNDRSDAVNQTDMKPTTLLYNQGDGDGSAVHAGSIVVDDEGFAFGRNVGVGEDRALIRAYWTESDAEKLLMGSL